MMDRFASENPPSVIVLTSPKAGSGQRRGEIPSLVELLEKSGIVAEITHSPDRLTEAVAALKPGQAERLIVVAAGGDGTISLAAEKLSPVVDSGSSPVGIPLLVPMPLGTENLLARYFGHRAEAQAIYDTIRFGRETAIDRGFANGRPFLTMVTCGFDAEVIRALHFRRKGHIRRLTYAGPISRAMRRYPFPRLDVRALGQNSDQWKTISCCWAMVFNLPCYATGLPIEPDAVGNDGMLDLITFDRGSVAAGFRYLAGILRGKHINDSEVTRMKVREVRVTSQGRAPCQIDGDYLGHLPLNVGLQAGAINLILPADRS